MIKMNKKIGVLCGLSLLFSVDTFAQCLATPSHYNTVTSMYGYRFHPVLKKWRLHKGIDLRAYNKTELMATHDGTVQVTNSLSGGNEIRIVSPTMVTRYLHLTRALVSPGTQVTAGQKVALSGNTGSASAAAHLHLEVFPRNKSGDVNPYPLFCTAPTVKSGADKSKGFPILDCSPDAAQCNSTGGPPPMTAGGGSSSGGGSVNMPTQDIPTGPNITAFDDMSTNEIFESEVAKRFSNPDWYRQLAEMDTRPLKVEQQHIYALRQYIKYHETKIEERIENLLAIKMARKVNIESKPDLDSARAATLRQ